MHRYPLLFMLLFTADTAHAEVAPQATQLNTGNIASLQPAGPDAIAGLGDWVISNGTLCAAISDINHETGFNPWGGELIDVHHCGRDDDQWPFAHAMANFDKDRPLQPLHIESTQQADSAVLTVTAEGDGVQLRTRYQVNMTERLQLVIDYELIRLAEGEPLTMFGLLILHPHLALTPYSLSTVQPSYSAGFNYDSLDRQSNLSILGAMVPADVHVLVGSAELSQISYGVQLQAASLRDEDGSERELAVFQVTDPTYSVQGVLSRPPWLGGGGKPGLLEYAQSRLMDIEPGEILKLRQVIFLGDRNDVASVTDQIYRGPTVSGSLDLPASMVHIHDAQGLPLTTIKPGPDGKFRARLPVATADISVSAKTPWGELSALQVRVEDNVDAGAGLSQELVPSFVELPTSGPMRLIFKGTGDTPDPDFHDNLLGFTLDSAAVQEIQSANYISLAGIGSDRTRVAIPPGEYRVLATRGMAYSVTEAMLTVAAGATVSVKIDPPMREVSTEGWLAADFHVHSAPSFDSMMPVDERLRSFVAQGGDVLVATEHDVLVNYQDDVQRLGLENSLAVINGIELTGMARTDTMPFTNGHLNIFPASAQPQQFSGGLIPHEGKRLRTLYADVKKAFGTVLLQLNHPRFTDPLDSARDNSYFDHLTQGEAYDPLKPLSSPVNQSLIEKDPESGMRDIDFDLMEIANGNNYERYGVTRRDWFSLLNQGEKIVASANSDTHGSREVIAIPQNYVKLPVDYDEASFIEAVREGRMTGTSGPLLTVSARSGAQGRVELGETVTQGDFALNIGVESAHWVPVEQLTVYLNGEVYHQQRVGRGEQLELPIRVETDSYLVVEVTGEPNALYQDIAPGFTPFAFSNPIFIDADSDGEWMPTQ